MQASTSTLLTPRHDTSRERSFIWTERSRSHLPLWKGLAGIGVSSFYYQQITGDSGSGANSGEFKGTTAGIGPLGLLRETDRKATVACRVQIYARVLHRK